MRNGAQTVESRLGGKSLGQGYLALEIFGVHLDQMSKK